MKIAINTRFLLKGRLEGIGWYTFEVCKRMVAAHPEDEFFFFFDRPYNPAFVFGPNVTPMVLSPPARHPFLFYLWFEYSVTNALKKIQADVFYSPDGFLSMRTSVPSFTTIHDIAHVHYPNYVPYLMRKYYQYFMPKFSHQAKCIFTVSEYSKKDICKAYSVAESKVQVFYNGCRNHFSPTPMTEQLETKKAFTAGQDYFICIGSIHPRKNIEAVINAFNYFKQHYHTDHQLVIVGRKAWKTGPFVTALNESPFRSEIILTGNVEDTILVKLLGSSKGLIYPSIFEGFGIPVLEALNCDIPVICSDNSSLPEVGGDAVMYVNAMEIQEIAEAMYKIVTNEQYVEHLIRQGRKQKLKFDWDHAAQGIYETFKN